MKITCLEKTKEDIINIFADASICIFEHDFDVICMDIKCKECVEKNIEWNITDD